MTERPEHDLTNPRADRVRMVARLTGRSVRSKTRKFRIEGPQGVREALRAHAANEGTIQELYYTPEAFEKHSDLAELIRDLDLKQVFVRSATPEVIAAMSDAQTPQGFVCVCHLVNREQPITVTNDYAVLLCGVQDPGNVGTIIRVADASATGAVILGVGSADVHNPKVVRSTVGSLFHLPIYQGQKSLEVIQEFKSRGWQILAADGYGEINLAVLETAVISRELDLGYKSNGDIDLTRPTLWLLGNEAQGLHEEELAAADGRVAVPLYGQAESLNVATAATLCLYASARAHNRPEE